MDYFKKAKLVFFLLVSILLFSCKKDKLAVLFTEISSPTSYELSQIKFISPKIGFACGGSQFYKSEIIRTLDGGETWQIIELPQNVERKQLYALDALPNGTVHAAGFGGVTYFSTDTCNTMTFQQDPFWGHWRSVCFRTQQEAVLCGRENLGKGYILGVTSSTNWVYPFTKDFYSLGMSHITFVDSMVGYITGFGGIIKTVDGGKKWNFTGAKNDFFTATSWASPRDGVAVGWEGTILKTTNGGEDWEKIRNGNKLLQKQIRLKSLAKNVAGELIAAGGNGCLLYSNNQGASWKELEHFTDVNFESVSFRDDNTFFVVGEGGRIFMVEL